MSVIDAEFAGALGSFRLDVAFRAPLRGVTALFGPSGSGKTTLLRCVAGLHRLPGRLVVADETWQEDGARLFQPTHRRAVGYVFQEPSLFPHLDVRRNLLFGARRAGGDAALGLEAVSGLLGLDRLLDRATRALSGGERQRVAIGRALLSRPRLLLLDEPLAALDRGARDDILPYLEALQESLAIPMLYVSHDIAEVARLADQVVVLAAGRKIAEGSVADIFERLDLQPATGRFEAGAVVTARVAGHDRRFHLTRLELCGQVITIPMVDLAAGDVVRLRIRARDVALGVQPPQGISIRNILAGHIVELREEADTAFAETLIDIGGARLRARLTREAVADLALEPGKQVYALVKSISFDRHSVTA